MTALAPFSRGALEARPHDVERLLERCKEGRSPQTLRAYTRDLENFAAWLKAPSAGSAVEALLRMAQGEANETVRAYRSSLVDKGIAPATIRGEVVGLDLEHLDTRGGRVSVLRKGKRKRHLALA